MTFSPASPDFPSIDDLDEPVDLRREHHWFSHQQGRRDGRNYGMRGDPSPFREGCWGFPAMVPTNPGQAHIRTVPQAYQQGFEETYEAALKEREEIYAGMGQKPPPFKPARLPQPGE